MPKDLAASIRDRLTQAAKRRGETPDEMLLRYGRERLLYRIAQSAYRDRFVLKGASLLYLWSLEPQRPTRDIDLLGYGALEITDVTGIMREICRMDVIDDGLTMDADSVRAEEIRENTEYGGVRVRLVARLAGARLHMQIDIGIGDVVTPVAQDVEYLAVLPDLGLPQARLRAYPKETVVAEKLQTMVNLGMINSRMKDYFDLAEMATIHSFSGTTLTQAVTATFARRQTPLPTELPLCLSDTFGLDPLKLSQWRAFIRRTSLPARDLDSVVSLVRGFAWPMLEAAAGEASFDFQWSPGGPWAPVGDPADNSG